MDNVNSKNLFCNQINSNALKPLYGDNTASSKLAKLNRLITKQKKLYNTIMIPKASQQNTYPDTDKLMQKITHRTVKILPDLQYYLQNDDQDYNPETFNTCMDIIGNTLYLAKQYKEFKAKESELPAKNASEHKEEMDKPYSTAGVKGYEQDIHTIMDRLPNLLSTSFQHLCFREGEGDTTQFLNNLEKCGISQNSPELQDSFMRRDINLEELFSNSDGPFLDDVKQYFQAIYGDTNINTIELMAIKYIGEQMNQHQASDTTGSPIHTIIPQKVFDCFEKYGTVFKTKIQKLDAFLKLYYLNSLLKTKENLPSNYVTAILDPCWKLTSRNDIESPSQNTSYRLSSNKMDPNNALLQLIYADAPSSFEHIIHNIISFSELNKNQDSLINLKRDLHDIQAALTNLPSIDSMESLEETVSGDTIRALLNRAEHFSNLPLTNSCRTDFGFHEHVYKKVLLNLLIEKELFANNNKMNKTYKKLFKLISQEITPYSVDKIEKFLKKNTNLGKWGKLYLQLLSKAITNVNKKYSVPTTIHKHKFYEQLVEELTHFIVDKDKIVALPTYDYPALEKSYSQSNIQNPDTEGLYQVIVDTERNIEQLKSRKTELMNDTENRQKDQLSSMLNDEEQFVCESSDQQPFAETIQKRLHQQQVKHLKKEIKIKKAALKKGNKQYEKAMKKSSPSVLPLVQQNYAKIEEEKYKQYSNKLQKQMSKTREKITKLSEKLSDKQLKFANEISRMPISQEDKEALRQVLQPLASLYTEDENSPHQTKMDTITRHLQNVFGELLPKFDYSSYDTQDQNGFDINSYLDNVVNKITHLGFLKIDNNSDAKMSYEETQFFYYALRFNLALLQKYSNKKKCNRLIDLIAQASANENNQQALQQNIIQNALSQQTLNKALHTYDQQITNGVEHKKKQKEIQERNKKLTLLKQHKNQVLKRNTNSSFFMHNSSKQKDSLFSDRDAQLLKNQQNEDSELARLNLQLNANQKYLEEIRTALENQDTNTLRTILQRKQDFEPFASESQHRNS